jgi:hypothetical protein
MPDFLESLVEENDNKKRQVDISKINDTNLSAMHWRELYGGWLAAGVCDCDFSQKNWNFEFMSNL